MKTLTKNSNLSIIITAAGSSSRMGGGIKKEYLSLQNGTVLSNCAKSFLNAFDLQGVISDIVITYANGGLENCKKAIEKDEELVNQLKKNNLQINYVEGGKSRQASVFNALKFIQTNNPLANIVLIHDGARPFVSSKVIVDVYNAAIEYGASVPGVTPVDTQKEIDEQGFIIRHLERNKLAAVQTPQGFIFSKLFEAHQKAQQDLKEYTDDTEVWGKYAGNVKLIEGDPNNKKITYPGDLK